MYLKVNTQYPACGALDFGNKQELGTKSLQKILHHQQPI